MKKYIKPDIVKQIADAANIFEVVSEYITLKKKGANYWGLSPFSREKTPSLSVNPAKNIYKCFSSGKGGNSVSFLMEVEGYNYVEALTHIANKYGIHIPEAEEPEDKAIQMESLHRILNAAQSFFQNRTEAFYQFVGDRSINAETAEKFGIGIAPNEWTSLQQHLINSYYLSETANLAGLTSISEKNGKSYDVFRNRIIFPIHNSIGKITGFGGRSLNKDGNEAKYINTQETLVYKKKRTLYGLFQAKTSIRQCNFAFLTEGYMDVVKMHQFGYTNTVATSGTALTEEQVRLLRRFTKKVVLIYDGDIPGIKAAMRAIDILIGEGMEVEILHLPDNHDPDSYLTQFGSKAFEEVLPTKYSFIDYKLKFGIESDTPASKRKAIEGTAKSIAMIGDKVEAQLYAQQVATKTGVDYMLIYDLIGRAEPPKPTIDLSFIDTALANQNTASITEIEITEKILVEFLVVYGNMILVTDTNDTISVSDYILESIAPLTFFNPTYQTIRNEYRNIELYAHTDDKIKMTAMSLNAMAGRIEGMMKDYDSFDIQNAWFDMIEKLVDTYKLEWHQRIFSDTMKKVSYKDGYEQYLQLVAPLMSVANTETKISKYRV